MINKPDDETLMAYADGLLSAAERSAIEEALAHWPDLADDVRAYQESRQALSDAFEPMAQVPPPQRLVDIALANPVEAPAAGSLEAARARKSGRPDAGWIRAVAACIALASAGIAGYTGGRVSAPEPVPVLAGRVDSGGWLASALSNVVSGETATHRNAVFTAQATYAGEAGDICREFDLGQGAAATRALACREEAGWHIQVAVAATGTPGLEGFRPASGDASEILDSVLDRMGAADALTTDAEACLKASGWSGLDGCVVSP